MVRSQTIQSLWDFRKQDEVDSSDDEYASASSTEPVFKKLKQISDLMSIKARQKSDINKRQSMERKRVEKRNKMQIKKRKDGESSYYGGNKRPSYRDDSRNKRGGHLPNMINNNHLYMQSILEDLRVARENLLQWVRGEIRKLMVDATLDHMPEEGCSRWKEMAIHPHNSVGSMSNIGLPVVTTEPLRVGSGLTTTEATSSMNQSHMQFPTSSICLTHTTVLPKKDCRST